jgi:hypothetical protein
MNVSDDVTITGTGETFSFGEGDFLTEECTITKTEETEE